MGARMAIDNAAEPEITPDHTATCARSVTPRAWTYIGRKGRPRPKPIRQKSCVAEAIQAVFSQSSRTGTHDRTARATSRRVSAADRTGGGIQYRSLGDLGLVSGDLVAQKELPVVLYKRVQLELDGAQVG